MSTFLRKLGPGPQTPIQGDMINGYFGKVTGIISGTELSNLTGVNSGTLAHSGDITWLKFKVNGKTLFVADRNIRTGISWDQINNASCVRGEKTFNIENIKYTCRLLTGGNQTLAASAGGEWYNTIVKYTPSNGDSNWDNAYTWCQEVRSSGNTYRVLRGYNSVSFFYYGSSDYTTSIYGWRPTLEVL